MLVGSPASEPTLDGTLHALLESGGHVFREVREIGGADPRDLLFAVAESWGVAFGPPSAKQAAGQIGTLVAARPVYPPLRMPDTMLAWRDDLPVRLHAIAAGARDVARVLHEHSRD